jgi:hypothetical protein
MSALPPTLQRVRLTDLQEEIVSNAHGRGIHPDKFADLLNHDPADVHNAITDLVDRALLVAVEGNTFRLTEQGEAAHRQREEADRAAVIRGTPSWQPR